MVKLRLGAIGIMTVVGGIVLATAQTPASTGFEIASIKQASFLNDSAFDGYLTGGGGTCAASAIRIAGNRVTLTRVTPCALIRLAYDIRDYQVAGAPDWMTKPDKSIYYDIDALVANGTAPTRDQAREMLRTLLADRFQLKIHHEMREAPVYALVVGRGGPHFPANGEKFVSSFGVKFCSDANATNGAGARNAIVSCGPGASGSMAALALHLSTQTDRAVVDKTGLTGKYAFMLQWTAEGGAPPLPDAPPSLFTAIQDQLGLKLEPQREPVDALVIEHVERPTPN